MIEKLVIGFGQIGKLASAGPVDVLPVAALVAPLTINSVTDEEPVVPPTTTDNTRSTTAGSDKTTATTAARTFGFGTGNQLITTVSASRIQGKGTDSTRQDNTSAATAATRSIIMGWRGIAGRQTIRIDGSTAIDRVRNE